VNYLNYPGFIGILYIKKIPEIAGNVPDVPEDYGSAGTGKVY